MRVIKYKDEEAHKAIEEAVSTLGKGELVILPTDTVYGLMAIASDEKAVEKLYKAKDRQKQKPTALLIDSLKNARKFVGSDVLEKLGKRFWPGPLTIIAESKQDIEGWPKIGIRVPDDSFLLQILTRVNEPVMASSANLVGEVPPATTDKISKKLAAKVVLAVDKGPARSVQASTIVEVKGEEAFIVREGPITARQIEEVLNL